MEPNIFDKNDFIHSIHSNLNIGWTSKTFNVTAIHVRSFGFRYCFSFLKLNNSFDKSRKIVCWNIKLPFFKNSVVFVLHLFFFFLHEHNFIVATNKYRIFKVGKNKIKKKRCFASIWFLLDDFFFFCFLSSRKMNAKNFENTIKFINFFLYKLWL